MAACRTEGSRLRALVTGATGFVGAHVVRVLIQQGVEVRALVRPTSNLQSLAGLPVETVIGTLTEPSSLEQAVQGVDLVFHVAADYRFWVPDPQQMHAVNVDGTVRLLEAALQAGVWRIVYTSSVVTVRSSSMHLGTEQGFVSVQDCRSTYQLTKVLAEQAVWQRMQQGAPITIVNPSTPIGALDWRPTPTGRLIVDFLNHRLPGFVDAAFNWIAVRDVAVGHWLAATRGRLGERYILGHQNQTLGEFLRLLSDVTGQPAPRLKIPYTIAYLAGTCAEALGRLTGHEPRATRDGVRMAAHPMTYDSSKAVKELGLPQTPLRLAVEEAVQWFREQGYITKRNA